MVATALSQWMFVTAKTYRAAKVTFTRALRAGQPGVVVESVSVPRELTQGNCRITECLDPFPPTQVRQVDYERAADDRTTGDGDQPESGVGGPTGCDQVIH
jgi:hypothetical protein